MPTLNLVAERYQVMHTLLAHLPKVIGGPGGCLESAMAGS